MAESKTAPKLRKRPQRRETALDPNELQALGRIGRELATLSPEGQHAVCLYLFNRFCADGQDD